MAEEVREVISQAAATFCIQVPTLEAKAAIQSTLNRGSRSGAHALDDLAAMCQACNERKGPLTTAEYSTLLTLMVHWPAPARQSVLRGLRAGGRFMHSPETRYRIYDTLLNQPAAGRSHDNLLRTMNLPESTKSRLVTQINRLT